MASLNEEIADSIVSRAVQLERLKAGETRKILTMLAGLEKDLIGELATIAPAEAQRTAFKEQRLERLLKVVQKILKEHYSAIHKAFTINLKEIAETEGQFALSVINKPVGIELATVGLSTEQLRAIASDVMISGSSTKEWWGRQSVDLQRRFADSMRQGLLLAETNQQLIQRVRGTQAGGFTDGILQTSRNGADTLVRSAVQAVANQAYEQTWDENDDVIGALVWTSTLDLRTSEWCIPRDGKQYTVRDHKPIGHSIPWLQGPGKIHRRCRSTSRPEIKAFSQLQRTDAMITGGRPTSIGRYVGKRLEDKGLEGNALNKAFSTVRASMDGPVSGNLTFEGWLKKRSVEEQNKVLGVGKATLWRQKKLSFSDLVDFRGNPLTLEQLREQV